VQKAEVRAKAALKEVETTHVAYQKSVTSLAEAQTSYDSTVVDVLQQFERLERGRMNIMVEQLTRYASLHDELKANMETCAASLHMTTQAINVPRDIQSFIHPNITGNKVAPHVEYIRRESTIIDHALDLKPSNSGQLPVGAGSFGSPAAQKGSISVNNSNATAMASAPAASPVGAGGIAAASFGGASVAASAAPAGSSDLAVALYDFDPHEADDLGFKSGQVIRLLACADGEDWWQGELDGKTGIFPKTYVQKQVAGGAPPAVSAAAPVTLSAIASAPAAASAASSNPFGSESSMRQVLIGSKLLIRTAHSRA